MKKILILLFFVSVASADSWWTVYVDDAGAVRDRYYTENTKPAHALLPNEYPANYSFPTNSFKFWKKVGADWVGMTVPEQQVLIDTENTKTADFELDEAVTRAQLKALILVLIDEINTLRAQHGLPARTVTQVKNAIKGKL